MYQTRGAWKVTDVTSPFVHYKKSYRQTNSIHIELICAMVKKMSVVSSCLNTIFMLLYTAILYEFTDPEVCYI